MNQYKQLLEATLAAPHRSDRTGTGTRSLFGYQTRFDLRETFPLVTLKRTYWHGIVTELLWFLRGDTNVKYLQDNGVHIWDEWADENGDLGPVYGAQFRRGGAADGREIDQIANVIHSIKTNPTSRRHIVSAWNVGELNQMALAPCHVLFQFYVQDHYLSCSVYQRSADVFLGVPFNIASYALLTHMVAQVTGLKPFELIYSFGDLHLYENHVEQAELVLQREPLAPPILKLNPAITDIDSFTHSDIELIGYRSHGRVSAPVAV